MPEHPRADEKHSSLWARPCAPSAGVSAFLVVPQDAAHRVASEKALSVLADDGFIPPLRLLEEAQERQEAPDLAKGLRRPPPGFPPDACGLLPGMVAGDTGGLNEELEKPHEDP